MRAILLVDREEKQSEFQRLLARVGVMNPVVVGSSVEAVREILSRHTRKGKGSDGVAAVFVHLHLNDCESFGCLQWMQSQPLLKNLLRVALVERARLKEVVRAYELGAQTFLITPPNEDDLSRFFKAFPLPGVELE